MRRGAVTMLKVLCVLHVARQALAYPAFRDEIPNGLRAGDHSSGMHAPQLQSVPKCGPCRLRVCARVQCTC